MDFTTVITLLAIGVSGITWSFIRQTKWYADAGERILVALDIRKKPACSKLDK